MFKFQTLNVWKKAIGYCDEILEIVENLPTRYQYTIGKQLIDSAVSIPNNIAEGSGRKNTKESKNFYNISKGSAYETINLLIILVKRKLYDKDKFLEKYQEAEEICKMLSGLIKK